MIISEATLIIVIIESFIIGFTFSLFRKITGEKKKDTLTEKEDFSFTTI